MSNNSSRARPVSRSASGSDSKDHQRGGLDDAKVQLEQHIQQVVAAAPPLTADQLARLAVLLPGSA